MNGSRILNYVMGAVILASAVLVAVLVAAPGEQDPAERLERMGADVGKYENGDVYSVHLYSGEIADSDIVFLQKLQRMKRLYFHETPVTDATLARVGEINGLKRLKLTGTRISDDGLRHVASLPEMKILILDNTAVTDAGLAHIKKLTDLYALNLQNTRVTDAGLEHLHGLSELRALNLRETEVTEEAAAELKESVPGCNIMLSREPEATASATRR